MKKIILIFGILSLVQCQSQEKKETDKKETMTNYTYKNNQRPLYVIGLTVPGPYELYINDIAAEKDYSFGMHNLGVDINPYVLKSGKYTFKLRVFPMPSELEKGGIQPSTASFIKVTLDKGEKNDQEVPRAKPGSYRLLREYPIPVITQPVPFLDIEGEFEVELPYELEGWSRGQDLTQMDSTRLKEKVVKYYEKIWNILNEGDIEKWNAVTQRRQQETYIFNYTSENLKKETQQEEYEIITTRTKGNMLPLEHYSLYIYGNGRLVSLERDVTKTFQGFETNIKGWSPLIRDDENSVTPRPIKLYLPQGNDEFVIIRK